MKFLFPTLLEHVLIVAGDSTTHVGHLLGLVDESALENHERVITLALGFLTLMESEIVGIGVLTLLHHHALHADVIGVLVVEGIGQGCGIKGHDVGFDQIEDAVVLGTEDDALEMRLVPIVLGAIGGKILLKSHGILACSLPDTTVADLKKQHAIAVLIEQVAILGVGFHELARVVVTQNLLGNGIHHCHDIILCLGDIGNLSLGIQVGEELRQECCPLVAIGEHGHGSALDLIYNKGRVISAIGCERTHNIRLKIGIEAETALVLEVIKAILMNQAGTLVAADNVLDGGSHLAQRGKTMSHFLDNVIAILCGERLTDSTVGQREGHILKFGHHASPAEPAQVTATGSICFIIGLCNSHFLKVSTSLQQVVD